MKRAEQRFEERQAKLATIFADLTTATNKLRKDISMFKISINSCSETLEQFKTGNIRCGTVELF